jgi:hypothetical protein
VLRPNRHLTAPDQSLLLAYLRWFLADSPSGVELYEMLEAAIAMRRVMVILDGLEAPGRVEQAVRVMLPRPGSPYRF